MRGRLGAARIRRRGVGDGGNRVSRQAASRWSAAMSPPATLKSRLRLPLIAAPMFLVSGPALVKAACRAGIIGSFPTANCPTVEELDGWLADMSDDLLRAADEAGPAPAPLFPNLSVHRSNPPV